MIPNVGPLEIAIVLVIALIVFGPKRLPELGRSLGKGINEFREGVSKIGDDITGDDDDDDDSDPVELTKSTSTEPEVTEIVNGESGDPAPKPEADEPGEAVDGEVVTESRD